MPKSEYCCIIEINKNDFLLDEDTISCNFSDYDNPFFDVNQDSSDLNFMDENKFNFISPSPDPPDFNFNFNDDNFSVNELFISETSVNGSFSFQQKHF